MKPPASEKKTGIDKFHHGVLKKFKKSKSLIEAGLRSANEILNNSKNFEVFQTGRSGEDDLRSKKSKKFKNEDTSRGHVNLSANRMNLNNLPNKKNRRKNMSTTTELSNKEDALKKKSKKQKKLFPDENKTETTIENYKFVLEELTDQISKKKSKKKKISAGAESMNDESNEKNVSCEENKLRKKEKKAKKRNSESAAEITVTKRNKLAYQVNENDKKLKMANNLIAEHESKATKKMKNKKLRNASQDSLIDEDNPTKLSRTSKKIACESSLPEREIISKIKRKRLKKKKSIPNVIENSDVTAESISEQDGRDSRTVFVGNVPTKFKKKQLLRLFKSKGEVEKMWTRGAKPSSDKISKKVALIANLLPEEHPPLTVHVLFKTAADAAKALELNGVIFDDHRLRVTHSRMKTFNQNKGVFVGNLPLNVKDDELYDMFSKCGDIVAARVVRDQWTGLGKGFGYVNFSSADSVELALQLNDEKLNGRELRVQRLMGDKKIKKLKKNKEALMLKNTLLNRKNKTKKTKNDTSQKKSLDKFQKKKKPKASDLKKIMAKKLTNPIKKKEKHTE